MEKDGDDVAPSRLADGGEAWSGAAHALLLRWE
jgi:hypothetical protein